MNSVYCTKKERVKLNYYCRITSPFPLLKLFNKQIISCNFVMH